MAFRYSPKIVTDGLVLCLDAANPRSFVSGSTTWNDLTKNLYNGSLINGPVFSGSNCGNIVFDGTNDYVNFYINTDIITNTNELTFNIWYSLSSSGIDTSLLEVGGFYNHWSFYWDLLDGGKLSFSITGNYGNRVTSTTNTKTGQWFNSCGTFSSNDAKIYTNGVLENTRNSIALLSQTGIKEGRVASDSLNNVMGGKVAIVQIYNKSLTSSEVLQNYNATKSRFGL